MVPGAFEGRVELFKLLQSSSPSLNCYGTHVFLVPRLSQGSMLSAEGRENWADFKPGPPISIHFNFDYRRHQANFGRSCVTGVTKYLRVFGYAHKSNRYNYAI